MILLIIIILEIIFSTIIFFVLGIKTFSTWKSIREELLLHLTFFFIAMSFITLIFSLYVQPDLFNLSFESNFAIIVFGVLYDLFYLEVSIIYNSIFSNSKTIFETYAPFLITALTFFNIFSVFSGPSSNSLFPNLFFHALIILIGLTLVILGIRHLIKSKRFINNVNETNFLSFLIRISFSLPIILISDGLGFLYYELHAEDIVNYNEMIFLILFSFLCIISLAIYLISKSIANRTKGINISNFLNSIS
jgi:hypothetical protein